MYHFNEKRFRKNSTSPIVEHLLASGQVRAVARAVTGGCAHYHCMLMKYEQY
jgi:hypothetical protein